MFGRAEYVRKNAEELSVENHFDLTQQFDVGHVSLGYIRELIGLRGATLGLGATGTLNVVPSLLNSAYGSRTPLGGLVFLRVRPRGVGTKGMRPPA